MEQIIRIGMDTSKHVFQLHGVNAAEVPVLRKKLRRNAYSGGRLDSSAISPAARSTDCSPVGSSSAFGVDCSTPPAPHLAARLW
jgi:hypothetical protein